MIANENNFRLLNSLTFNWKFVSIYFSIYVVILTVFFLLTYLIVKRSKRNKYKADKIYYSSLSLSISFFLVFIVTLILFAISYDFTLINFLAVLFQYLMPAALLLFISLIFLIVFKRRRKKNLIVSVDILI